MRYREGLASCGSASLRHPDNTGTPVVIRATESYWFFNPDGAGPLGAAFVAGLFASLVSAALILP